MIFSRLALSMLAFVGVLASVIPTPVDARDYRSRRWSEWQSSGGRLSWSHARNLIAFDQKNASGYFDIKTATPDGASEICVTCGVSALPSFNKGNPEWHPSGKYLVLQVDQGGSNFGDPGVGLNNDVWIMDYDARRFFQITSVRPGVGAVLHPQFSNKGDKLMWSERVEGEPKPSGRWVIRLGDFSVAADGTPRVTNIQDLNPGTTKIFYETHGFTNDDTKIVFTGILDPGQFVRGYDIYIYDLATHELKNLTNTPDQWDEHAKIMPSDNKIVWMSSMRAPVRPGAVCTEYWMMDLDGGNKNQITFFNDSRGSDFQAVQDGCVVMADSDWSADGTKLAAYMILGGSQLATAGKILMIDLEPAVVLASAATYLRPPIAPEGWSSIFGENLATQTLSASGGPFPTTLGDTSVNVTDAKGVTRPAELLAVSPGQINFLMPAGTADGPGIITVRNGNTEQRATIPVETVVPGIFTANQSGDGVPSAQTFRVLADGTQTAYENVFDCSEGVGRCTARPIDLGAAGEQAFLVLYATGLRHRRAMQDVTVTIAGIPAELAYAGSQNIFEGLDQINVRLPRELAGRTVTLNLEVSGIAARPVELQFR